MKICQRKHFLNNFKDFYVALECNFTGFKLKFSTFTQQNFFYCFLRKNEPFSQKERWMPNLRQQTCSSISSLRQQNSPPALGLV